MDKLRLRILSQLGLVWTFARLGWGLIALTTVLRGWLVEASRSRLFYSVVLVRDCFSSVAANRASDSSRCRRW